MKDIEELFVFPIPCRWRHVLTRAVSRTGSRSFSSSAKPFSRTRLFIPFAYYELISNQFICAFQAGARAAYYPIVLSKWSVLRCFIIPIDSTRVVASLLKRVHCGWFWFSIIFWRWKGGVRGYVSWQVQYTQHIHATPRGKSQIGRGARGHNNHIFHHSHSSNPWRIYALFVF